MSTLLKSTKCFCLSGSTILIAAMLLCPRPTFGLKPESGNNKVITGEQLFERLVSGKGDFPNPLRECKVQGKIPRISSVRLQGAEFVKVIFEGDINIEGTIFTEVLSFRNCTFKSAVKVFSKDCFSLFSMDDLKDAASLVIKLRNASDSLSLFLQEQFSPETRQLLSEYDDVSRPSEPLQNALIQELNRLLQDPSLYDEDRFAHVTLSQEAQQLIAQDPQGEGLIRLNRLLLGEAYPHAIEKSPKDSEDTVDFEKTIRTRFDQGITFKNCVFEEEVFFDECWFGNPADEQGVGGIVIDTVFENCTFNKKLNMLNNEFYTRINFQNCTFDKELQSLQNKFHTNVAFSSCIFYDDVSFGDFPSNERQAFEHGIQDDDSKKTVFNGPVVFTMSVFKRKAFFPYAELFDVDFSETIFEGPARFSKAKFKGNSNFSRAIFEAPADFERAIFYPGQSTTDQPEQFGCADNFYANFYKASFKNDVSFSKAIFLINTDFKRVNFAQRAFFTNTIFAQEANFAMCFFSKELLGSKINDVERIVEELTFYQLKTRWKEQINKWKKQHNNSEEPNSPCEKWFYQVGIWQQIKQEHNPTADVVGEINVYLRNKFEGAYEMEGLGDDEDLEALIDARRGKEAYIDSTTFTILDAFDFSFDQNQCIFTGAHFGGEVDFRGVSFNEADFSSGETITVFYGLVDFSNAFFGKISLDGTVFSSKVLLPLESLFPKSKMISRSVTLFDLPLVYLKDLRKTGDALVDDSKSRRKLYNQLEPLFRNNLQLPEANEMAVRASWLNFRNFEDMLASIFTLIALPIKNLLLIMLAVNLFFYGCLVRKGSIYGRIRQSSFKPGKLPLVLIRSGELKDQETDQIVRIGRWQRYSWPLFLCLGTFFAFFSLGSEYVTDDESCLQKMKGLRLAGFIILPLFIYSLAKRSEGLHKLFTVI